MTHFAEASAETEEAWMGCGQKPGIKIWRIVVSVNNPEGIFETSGRCE